MHLQLASSILIVISQPIKHYYMYTYLSLVKLSKFYNVFMILCCILMMRRHFMHLDAAKILCVIPPWTNFGPKNQKDQSQNLLIVRFRPIFLCTLS